jgi:ATP synthase protein I
MSADPPSDPLAQLGDKIERARQERAREEAVGRGAVSGGGALGAGFRIAIELVAALCVGLALGWVFDRILGTRPWGLIVFFFLGAAAGMLNVFRAVKNLGLGDAQPSSGEDRTQD